MKKHSIFLFVLLLSIVDCQVFIKHILSGPKMLWRDIKSLFKDETMNGKIPLCASHLGYYVNSDLANHSHSLKSKFPIPQEPDARMMIALYDSRTILVNQCLNFSHYSCGAYQCKQYPTDLRNIAFPYFHIQGHTANAEVYLDYDNWCQHDLSILADSCTARGSSQRGSNTIGVLGLGFNNSNFVGSKIFSIYLERDLKRGILLFQQDLLYSQTEKPLCQFISNEDWHLRAATGIKVGDFQISFASNTSLIFDINADAIGFPLDVYKGILLHLLQFRVVCPLEPLYKPLCLYEKPIKTLPVITIMVQGQQISLPPQLYVDMENDLTQEKKVILNIKALMSILTGDSYVTPQYENYIILDSHVMSYYYTVFDISSNVVSIYYANHLEPLPEYVKILIYVGEILLVILLWMYCLRNKRKSKFSLSKKSSLFQYPQQRENPNGSLLNAN